MGFEAWPLLFVRRAPGGVWALRSAESWSLDLLSGLKSSSKSPRLSPELRLDFLGLHLTNISIPSWRLDPEPNLLYPALFPCSGTRSPPPLLFSPSLCSGGVTRSPPPFSHPLPNHFLEAWHFIQGRLGQGGCKKKKIKSKIGAVSSSWSAALATSLSFPLAA